MPIKMITSLNSISDYLNQCSDEMIQAILDRLCWIGELCIKEARENGSYGNPTGNLRSSIGYAVVKDGEVYSKSTTKLYFKGSEGIKEGQKFLNQKIGEYANKKGLFLIVTAGMNYAECVEARGYNVLTSAELKAEDMAKNLINKLGFE